MSLRNLTSGWGTLLVEDRQGSFNVIQALLFGPGLFTDSIEVEVWLMKFEYVAQKDSAFELLNNIIQGEIVFTDIESVDPPDKEVLLKRA